MPITLTKLLDGTELPALGITSFLIQHAKAVILDRAQFRENLVCVESNSEGEVALYCATIQDYNGLTNPHNGHTERMWMVVPDVKKMTLQK